MAVRSRLMTALAAVASAVLALAGCTAVAAEDRDGLTVYATTGYLADAVRNIAPEATVVTMVGPGGDPHTYQPSTKDIEQIHDADLVLWTGLNLEAHMVDQLRSLGDKQLAVGEQLPEEQLLSLPETDADGEPLHDPHIWNSPDAWSLVVGHVADKLGEVDPARAEAYQRNAAEYRAEIADAAAEAEKLLAGVPEPRMLVTAHDAFNYFGKTYDLQVHATDFVSTAAVLSAEELSGLAAVIAEYRIPVIFQDNQANPQAITSLQEAVRALDFETTISDTELYADSLGAEPGVDTYLGVFRHNARAVAAALGKGAA